MGGDHRTNTPKTSGQHRQDAFPQVVPHQAEAGQGPEAEQAHPPVDPPEDWQHHQVQRQEEALAQDPHRYLSDSLRCWSRMHTSAVDRATTTTTTSNSSRTGLEGSRQRGSNTKIQREMENSHITTTRTLLRSSLVHFFLAWDGRIFLLTM